MRVLVVGASGFIGSYLVKHLAGLGHEVEGWGRRPEDPGQLHRYRSLDLTDPHTFRGMEGRWDAAYLLSAHAVPGLSWNGEMVLENLGIVGRFLEFIRSSTPECRVIIASSALVYGPSETRLTELHPRQPRSFYALSKVMAEDWGAYAAHSLDIQIARIFNQVGASMPKGLLAMDALERIQSTSESLAFHGSDSIRDYMDVRDGADALSCLMEVKASSGSIWNICSGEGHSVSQLATYLMDHLGTHKPIQFKQAAPDTLVGDGSKLQIATGWRPRHSLGEALAQLAEAKR